MAIKIVQSGEELEIREALAYLDRRYGIRAGHVRSIGIEGAVGEPMSITVTVYVQDDVRLTPDVIAELDSDFHS